MTQPILEWTDDFLIGIKELDYEHQQLIKDINELHRELVEHDTVENIEDTLGSIHARMQSHFALEEHFMEAHAYPHYVEHKAEHINLLDDYTDFMAKYEKAPDEAALPEIEEFLAHWIAKHIMGADKKMASMAG